MGICRKLGGRRKKGRKKAFTDNQRPVLLVPFGKTGVTMTK